jgi:sulfite reductase (NADPH) flavoprotein alpha-component
VCGDAQQMAPDVHAALREAIRTHGALDAEAADEFLLDLQRDRRYQKDVY